MLKSYTLRDWHIFMEVFGMPLRVGKYDSNATPEDKQRLKQAVSEIGVDAAGIIPDSMKIEFIESMKSQGGEKLFQGAADWLDAQVSKGILGQTMTADNGSSESQARVHDEVRGDILDADNRQIRTPINTQLAKPYVDLNFGARENYPRVVVKAEEPEDDEKNAKTVSTLVQAGMPIPQSWAYEKFGIPEPKAGEAVLVPAKMAVPSTEPVEPGEGGGDEGGGGAPTEPAENARAANFMADRIARLERALNRESRTEDTIDEVAEQAVNENWEPMLEGTVGRIIDMARNSGTFEELKAKLDGAVEQFQVSRAQAELAKACFKARGFGDATDDMHR
jgi:phage gp29-like protein